MFCRKEKMRFKNSLRLGNKEMDYLTFIESSRYNHHLVMDRINFEELAKSVEEEMPASYTEEEFMERMALRSGSMANRSIEYDKLAAMILIELHERRTSASFVEVVRQLQGNRDVMGRSRPILSEEFVEFIETNREKIEELLVKELDHCFLPTLFGWKTLVKSYLLRSNGGIRERMPHMFMRVALFIHRGDWEKTTQALRDMMSGRYTHATPTLFHAGTRRSQMASCFMEDAEVWTYKGRKKIKDVKIGDRVITHNGRIGVVEQVHKNLRGFRQLFDLYSEEHYIATATGDHEFYALDCRTGLVGWTRLDKLTTHHQLKRAQVDVPLIPYPCFVARRIADRLVRESPRLAGAIFARMTLVSSTLDEEEYVDIELPIHHHGVYERLVRKLDMGVSVQANMLHICEHEIIMTFGREEMRAHIMRWVLENGSVEFARGWEDVHREDPDVPMYSEMEADQWGVIMSTLLGAEYRSHGKIVYKEEFMVVRGCCKRSIPLAQKGFVRFQKRVWAPDVEYVYTLGIAEDHSYSVGGVIAKNCFLMGTEDSVTGIFKTLSDTAQISKWAGGIGVHISNIRASGSYIYGTNGKSNGILPMLKVYNDVSRYIDQCFAPDVMVMTSEGMRPIGEIQKGDEVLNSRGEFCPVGKVLRYDWDGEMMSIEGARVTDEHNVMVGDGDYKMLSEVSDCESLVFPKPHLVNVEEDVYYSDRIIRFLVDCAYRWKIQDNGIISSWQDSMGIVCELVMGLFSENEYGVEVETGNVWVRTQSLNRFLEAESKKAIHQPPEIRKRMLRLREKTEMEPMWMTRMMVTMEYLERGRMRKISEMRVANVQYQGRIYDLEMTGGDPSYVTQMGVVHNGGGKRSGAFAMYIEPWHADVMDFILAKRNAGAEEERARDLFYGLWIPDLFMERVERDEMWSLFCPSKAPDLADTIGDEFKALFTLYEEEKRYEKQMRARELWTQILRSQIETGTPYMLYKDACNYRSNQQNLGVIKSSNLCVVGETRLLTPSGCPTIQDLYEDEKLHKVWTGSSFAGVRIQKTGQNQSVMRMEFSNGLSLTCTPYHKFYVIRNTEVVRIEAQEMMVGEVLESYSLPSRRWRRTDVPESVRRTLVWIMKKNHVCAENLSVYSSDKDSLEELLLQLQWCGMTSTIHHHTIRNEYELRMNRIKAERLIGFVMGTDLNGKEEDVMEVEGECVENISLCSMEKLSRLADTYCFTEPETGRGLFNGICTGQCTEIIEYSDDKEYAVCNLASIALPRFILPNPKRRLLEQKKMVVYSKKDCPFCCLLELETQGMNYEKRDILEYATEWEETRRIHALTTVPAIFLEDQYLGGFTEVWKSHLSPLFEFKELQRVVGAVVQNLNRIIDLNVYPLPETEVSNKKHRPIGVGVQGLADVFGALRLAFDEQAAKGLNRDIFETIYYAALVASNDLARVNGPYSTFRGSPLSLGKFHFDLMAPIMTEKAACPITDRYDWEALRQKIILDGVRNSLLIAPMPTASTSQILGNNECFEPWTSNVFLRRTNAGEFYVCNSFLRRDLEAMGQWNEEVMNRLILAQGSVAQFPIPHFLKNIYRTVWEIPQKSLIDMAADRQYFIDQSQSLNIFMAEPSFDVLTKVHFYGWKKGLKTGCYYIRSRPPVSSINFAIGGGGDANNASSDCLSCSA